MLLHYADVSEFLHDERFKLPSLHNTHIFQYDFFDDPSPVWTQSMVFDWIIGNPPWIEANHTEEPFAAAWIDTHRKQEPVDNNSIAEAFSWRVLRLLAPTGYVGLILPAALLYNLDARKYRQSFFEQCEVQRMTNFSNLRGELFEGRATAPAITMIYHQAVAEQEKLPIEHYGPFAINQITKSYGKLWTITINEHEYQTVSPYEAAHGNMNAAWKDSIYSDIYFVVQPRQIGLSAPHVDEGHLRALSVFLSSSLIKYYLFFQTPQWGIERDVITLNTVRSIPIPELTLEQVEQLAALQKQLISMELEQGAKYAQAYLDEQVIRILQVPESITTLVTEFLQLRSKLVGGGTKEAVQRIQQRPDQEALQAYAQQLTSDLDGFLDAGKTHHRVVVERSRDLICCTVEFVRSDHAFTLVVKEASAQNGQMFTRLQQELKAEFTQWVYVQRGLKIFASSSVSLYKVPQLINWTRTQAMNDADDMIAEILSTERQHR